MKIRLIDVDGCLKHPKKQYPNLALMKISTYYKENGHDVRWATGFDADILFASKIFTFTLDPPELDHFECPVKRGGTGYSIERKLPPHIEAMPPDYSLYPYCRYAIGFLTRGCIRSCPWCVVPKKEGAIQVTGDILTIAAGRRDVVLLDNNFLAAEPDFINDQLEKAQRAKLRLDFNQALDARLVTPPIAAKLAGCRWRRYIRFACDSDAMLDPVYRAVTLIREAGYHGEFSVYLLVQDVGKAEKRLKKIIQLNVTPFAQPYRDFKNEVEITDDQKRFTNFVNIKGGKLPLKMEFKDYWRK